MLHDLKLIVYDLALRRPYADAGSERAPARSPESLSHCYANAQNRFCRMIRIALPDSSIASTTPNKSARINVISVASMAMSVAAPMAMPRSAGVRAQASYAVATVAMRRACSFFNSSTFRAGAERRRAPRPQFGFGKFRRRNNTRNVFLALDNGAGLIEHHRIDAPAPFRELCHP